MAATSLGAEEYDDRPANASACFRNCSGGGLSPSPQRWREACANRSEIDVLMAPKTGSEFLIASMKSACPSNPHANTKFHTKLYRPCSVVSLRDPCERLHSTFAHLINKYPSNNSCHSGGVFTCPTHWINHVQSVDDFAYAVRDHWDTIRAHDTRDVHTKQRKDYILLQPQHIWVGNLSYVTCQNRLSDDVLALTMALRCTHVQRFLAGANKTRIPRVSRDPTTNRLVRFANASAQYDAVARFGTLSAGACAMVKELYWQDELLFGQHCRDVSR